jgi:hypothetical protein
LFSYKVTPLHSNLPSSSYLSSAIHVISDYHVERLKIFHGTFLQAQEAANQNEDQSVVSRIDAWKGDPTLKSTMSVRVTFGDGTVVWLPTTSIKQTIPYQNLIKLNPCLHHLLRTTVKASGILSVL